ncbi:signal peptidase I [Rheinheimera sp. EpRS3]|uniref:signal peptidase I n=1 Tax=Rheinheimera sp. EpRS3 TaxID=1712383 RepID=UPI000745F890|nr:signal peptidase I [Rheinheimera sp. EpRS3]KUM53005.1 S26 family signal peptidase [Rheinheimera sp. EpRS3]
MAGYFAIFLVLLTLASGLIWLLDALVLAPKRQQKLAGAQSAAGGQLPLEAGEELLKEPQLVETAKSIFPVIALITIFRSFIYEPFQIPSGSMMPTLLVGDFILVEKFSYDVKDPVWRKTLYSNNKPQRGDVAVFKYPEQPTIDYIKRVIGVPGDRVIYRNKQLFIEKACTGAEQADCDKLEMVELSLKNEGEFYHDQSPQRRYTEQLGQVTHDILQTPARREHTEFFFKQRGTAIDEFVVPEGHYFVLGDNRDNSRDGRFWGFVPEHNMVGKAVFIWMSFEFNEDPNSWVPGWVPTGVRFDRLGPIH